MVTKTEAKSNNDLSLYNTRLSLDDKREILSALGYSEENWRKKGAIIISLKLLVKVAFTRYQKIQRQPQPENLRAEINDIKMTTQNLIKMLSPNVLSYQTRSLIDNIDELLLLRLQLVPSHCDSALIKLGPPSRNNRGIRDTVKKEVRDSIKKAFKDFFLANYLRDRMHKDDLEDCKEDFVEICMKYFPK